MEDSAPILHACKMKDMLARGELIEILRVLVA